MKHLQLFENFKSPEDWQIGDIIVSLETKYADGDWLHIDFKYEIVEIAHANTTVKVKEVGYPYSSIEKYTGRGKTLNCYFMKYCFITLEEWELKEFGKKYNI